MYFYKLFEITVNICIKSKKLSDKKDVWIKVSKNSLSYVNVACLDVNLMCIIINGTRQADNDINDMHVKKKISWTQI